MSILRDQGFVSKADAESALKAYELLRRCEMALRRFDNRSVSSLPAEPDEHTRLARRLGYKEVSGFAADCREARDTIHALYQQYIKASGQSS